MFRQGSLLSRAFVFIAAVTLLGCGGCGTGRPRAEPPSPARIDVPPKAGKTPDGGPPSQASSGVAPVAASPSSFEAAFGEGGRPLRTSSAPLLENSIPRWSWGLPMVDPAKSVENPVAVTLHRGLSHPEAKFLPAEDRSDMGKKLKAALESGKAVPVGAGRWLDVWPVVVKELGRLPAIRFSWGRLSSADRESLVEFNVNLGNDRGSQAIRCSAAYVIPKDSGAWLITTRVELPDCQAYLGRSLDQGYTRTGETRVMKLEETEALAALRERLEACSFGGISSEAASLVARGDAHFQVGRWKEALKAYEEALKLGGPALFRDPSFRLKLAHADFKADAFWVGIENLLEASYLAEEQDNLEVLSRAVGRMKEVAAAIRQGEIKVPGEGGSGQGVLSWIYHRLCELQPEDPLNWYRLAWACLDRQRNVPLGEAALNVAYSTAPGRAGEERAGRMFLVLAGWKIRESIEYSPGRWTVPESGKTYLARGRELAPEEPYGAYLQALLEAKEGDPDRALEVLSRAPEIAGQDGGASGGGALDLHRLSYVSEMKVRPESGPRWEELPLNIGARPLSPSREPPVWSRDGGALAVAVHAAAVGDPPRMEDFVYVLDTRSKTGSAIRLEQPARSLAWSARGDLYFMSGDSFFVVRKDASTPEVVVAGTEQAVLRPDGNAVAFVRGGIWVRPLAPGSKEVQVSTGRYDALPLWYPSGASLIYAEDTGRRSGDGAPNAQRLVKVDLGPSGAPERKAVIDPTERIYCGLEWLVEGKELLVTTGWDDSWEWHVFRLEESKPASVTTLGQFYAGDLDELFGWSEPPFVALRRGGTITVAGADGRQTSSFGLYGFAGFPALAEAYGFRASRSRSKVCYVYFDPAGSSLWVMPAGKGADSPASHVPLAVLGGEGGRHQWSCSWSPDDGTVAAVTRGKLVLAPVR